METASSSIPLDNMEEYKNISLWEQEENQSTYYDRKLDLQGEVPGRSLEEARAAFQRKYGLDL